MTVNLTAAPRWPADAPLTAEELAAIAEDDQHRHEQRALAVRALHELRKTGWVRSRSYDFTRQLGYTFHHPDQPGRVLNVETWGDLTIWFGWFSYEVEDIRVAVDMLAALHVLPVRLSSLFDAGHAVGFHDGIEHVTEQSIETRFDLYVDDLWKRLEDPDVLHQIGCDLEGLLDVVPFVRRRQVDRVVKSVLAAIGADDE